MALVLALAIGCSLAVIVVCVLDKFLPQPKPEWPSIDEQLAPHTPPLDWP